jgi:hypothetical protein
MDNTIYREFVIECLGKATDWKRHAFFDRKDKYLKGKQVIYKYNPKTDYDDKLPDYKFDNCSGNEIKNPYFLTLKKKEGNNSSEDSTEYDSSIQSSDEKNTESHEETDKLPPVIARAVRKFKIGKKKGSKKGSKKTSKKGSKKGGKKIESETKYPFLNSEYDYTSELY